MTIHPTKPGQVVSPLIHAPLMGLRMGETYKVTAASFEWQDDAGLAIQLNGGGPWLRAYQFQVIEPGEQLDQVTPYSTLMQTYSEARADYIARRRASDHAALMRQMDLFSRNGVYGRFGSRRFSRNPLFSQACPPSSWQDWGSISVTYTNPHEDPEPMSIIPPLEVPAAPTQPVPEPLPPESASVQMLRKLLDERRSNLAAWASNKRDSEDTVAELKAGLARAEDELAETERGIAAATGAIKEILADIAKLGGHPEAVEPLKAAA